MAGCSDTADPNASDKKDLLTSHTWVTTKYTVDGTNETGPTSQTFNDDGTYSTVVLGSTRGGTWEFNVDETNVEITEDGSVETSWEIRTLTSSSLKLRLNLGGAVTELEAVPQ